MEGLPHFSSPESKSDDDDDSPEEKKSESSRASRASRGRDLAHLITGAERKNSQAQEQRVAAKSGLLDKILSGARATEQQASDTTAAGAEIPPWQRKAEDDVAEHLAETGDVVPEELVFPEDRDTSVVDRALEYAAESDVAKHAVEDAEAAAKQETENYAEAVSPGPESATAEMPEPQGGNETSAAEAESTTEENDDTTASSTATPSARAASAAAGGSASAGSGAGGGSESGDGVPPVSPSPRSSTSSTRSAAYTNANPLHSYTSSPAGFNAAQSSPNVLSPAGSGTDAEDIAYRRGRNRGLVAGLILGGGIEHIHHKRREKRMERTFAAERKEQVKQFDQKLETMRWDQIREKDSEKLRQNEAEKYKVTPVAEASGLGATEAPRLKSAEAVAVAPVLAAERLGQPPAESYRVASEVAVQAEQERQSAETQRIIAQAEQAEQQLQQEQLEIAQGNRIERSAWHNIEVDKTGKAVQEGALEYGHEYYQERAHETGPKIKQQVDAVAGEVALVAAALSESQSPGEGNHEVDRTARSVRRTSSALNRSGSSNGGDSGNATHSTPSDPQYYGLEANRPRSIIKTVTSPPTTVAGTVGWFMVLVLMGIVYFVFIR
ncbi:hypothetical protein JNM87_02915 [Candidatus Saccharibacteria bacterium]|nr:hypothetical protein [Candidatus Saccharibacteria bacterium]